MSRPLPQDKPAARNLIRAGRRARPAGARETDARALADHVTMLVDGHEPGVAAAYDALPTEPPMHLAIETLRISGWRVIVPILLPDNDLGWDDGNVRDPSYVCRATLLLVPALAVDRHGARLGQGGGSYDRALARGGHAASGLPRAVAVVYDDEVVERVPHEKHDIGVDAVLTPRGGLRLLDIRL